VRPLISLIGRHDVLEAIDTSVIPIAAFGLLAIGWLIVSWHSRSDRQLARVYGIAGILAAGIAGLIGLHRYDMEASDRARHYQTLQIAELERTLEATQAVRDQLTGQLEVAQESVRKGERKRHAMLDAIDQKVDAARTELATQRDALMVPSAVKPADHALKGHDEQHRLQRIISELEAFGGVRARPTVRLESTRGDEPKVIDTTRDTTRVIEPARPNRTD
jgi:hypothetical protein